MMPRFRKQVATGLVALGAIAGGLLCSSSVAWATGPLEVSLDPPTNVMAKSATLSGTVNPNGEPVAQCEFRYHGRSFGNEAICTSTPSGSTPVMVSGEVKGLPRDSAVNYHLRVITVEGEEVNSAEGLLVTPPTTIGSALASGVTSFAATLTGLIGSGELTPTYHFAYGPTGAYGSSMPSPDAEADVGGVQSVSQTLTGLQPDTTYHFALVVSNFGGVANVGPDATFTTRPLVPPGVATGSVEAVGQGAATLTGAVDPEGLETTYSFEYGTSAGYGSVWPSAPAHAGSGSGSGGEGAAVAVENLQPETTYHYRLVASNEDGTTYGADQTFTTAPHLVSVIQEAPVLAPPPGAVSPPKASRKSASKPKKHGKKKSAGHRKARRPAKRGKRR